MSNNVFIDLTEELYNKGWTVHWEFNSDIDPALLKYNDCVDYIACRAINPNVATDVDENGAWNYRLDNLEIGGLADEESGTYEGLFMIDISLSPNTSLKSFNVDLPNLTDGCYMFTYCTNLTEWNIPLPNLTNGFAMFVYCTNLTEWNIPLPNLTNGFGMFNNTALESFNGDLPNLTNGFYMFGDSTKTCTKLNLASVQNIAETINDLTGKTPDGSYEWGKIDIGISSAIRDNADLETALAAIRAKGWTVGEMYRS